MDLLGLQRALQLCDEKLRPIADTPIDINDPEWVANLKRGPHPLDQAGIRLEAETLLAKVLDTYANGDNEQRVAIRKLIDRYRAFTWATGVPSSPLTNDGFRQHLLRISANDQGQDARDEILFLNELCEEARNAGVTVDPILREVALISSDIDKHGMGSMRQLLLKATRKTSK